MNKLVTLVHALSKCMPCQNASNNTGLLNQGHTGMHVAAKRAQRRKHGSPKQGSCWQPVDMSQLHDR